MIRRARRAVTAMMLTTALAAVASTAQAECLTDLQAAAMVANYLAKKPAANPEGLSAADGECSRAKFNHFLAQQIGNKTVGYKAGLTNPAVQKRFGASAPVWGVLYAPMMLADGATLDAAFGARARCSRPTCWCECPTHASTRRRRPSRCCSTSTW